MNQIKSIMLAFALAASAMNLTMSGQAIAIHQDSPTNGDQRFAIVFKGGYETDPRDGGRPVALIAAALGVSPDVFRAAFSNVRPAAGGQEPEPGQVRRNKDVLMRALSPYGITNDSLDTVSNFYRYDASRGEMWRHTPATAYATVRNGRIIGLTITNPGAGYSSQPQMSIPGMTGLKLSASISFNSDFKKNGSIETITMDQSKSYTGAHR